MTSREVEEAGILIDPATAAQLPLEDIPRVLTAVTALEGLLAAARAVLVARLAAPTLATVPSSPAENDLLRVEEASKHSGMSKTWLYKNAAKLPFAHRIGKRSLRFSAAGIARYLKTSRAGGRP
jgi:predicted DNA-binding transcriptional regulator AlpA